MSKEKKIKVAIISGESVRIIHEVKNAVYPVETETDRKDVLDFIKTILEENENERLVVEIKYVKKSWYEKLKQVD